MFITNQRMVSVRITTDTQVVAAGVRGLIVGARLNGSAVTADFHDGTSSGAPKIGGLATAVTQDAELPVVPGHLPEFTNGLWVELGGSSPGLELLYVSESVP